MEDRYIFGIQAVVQEIIKVINMLDDITIYMMPLQNVMIPISLLDIFEAIFGVSVLTYLIYNVIGFDKQIGG